MPVKRRLGKQREGAISDTALALFEEMRDLPCTCSAEARKSCRDECPGCRRWWELHPLLRRALNENMWNFPTISRHAPDRRRAYEPDSEEGRYLRLEQALAARRQRAQVPEAPTAA